MSESSTWSTEITASPAPLADVPLSSGSPEVSIVIVTFGTGPVVVDCLSAVAEALRNSRRTADVVVVDQPHPTRPGRTRRALLTATRGVRLVTPAHNLGFGGGCELGALVGRGDVLCFLNPDTEVPDGFLDPLVDAAEASDVPVIVSPVFVDPDGTIQEVFQRLDTDGRGHVVRDLDESTDVIEGDYASAATWVVRREHHERAGGFDPAYFPAYYDDVDLAMRMRAIGGRTVTHQGVRVVHHLHGGTPDRPTTFEPQRQIFLRTWPEVAERGRRR